MSLTSQEFAKINRSRCESPQGFNHPVNGWSTSAKIGAPHRI